jgi:hypothetical protein
MADDRGPHAAATADAVTFIASLLHRRPDWVAGASLCTRGVIGARHVPHKRNRNAAGDQYMEQFAMKSHA